MKKIILLTCVAFSVAKADVLVVMRDGQVQLFTQEQALARASEQPFAQALGYALPVSPMTYRQIWQRRQCNTTTDAAIERSELAH